MSTTQKAVIEAAKSLAQDPSNVPLLAQTQDYTVALNVALKVFDSDVANLRIVHHVVSSATFRFVLSGSGALAELTGLNAWVDGRSAIQKVWHPYSIAVQAQAPLDPNTYRVIDEPGLIILELLELTPNNGTIRLEFTRPHAVHATDAAQTSVKAGDVEALQTIVAVKILELFAVRALQNTGSTGIPTDVVDRRSQSDQAASRCKQLMETYKALVGRRDKADLAPASSTKDLDVDISHVYGPLWHFKGMR